MGFIPPALTNQISAFGTTMIYIVISIVECDTGKYHEFIAEYCYECEARVTILRQRTSDIFPGVEFYYGNNDFIVWLPCEPEMARR